MHLSPYLFGYWLKMLILFFIFVFLIIHMEYVYYIVRPIIVFILVYFAVKESLRDKFIIEVKNDKKKFLHPNVIIVRVLRSVIIIYFIINMIIIEFF